MKVILKDRKFNQLEYLKNVQLDNKIQIMHFRYRNLNHNAPAVK